MTQYETLNDAMDANDELAEARMRYKLLADAFEAEPKLRSQLAPAMEKAKAEIVRLHAVKNPDAVTNTGNVVAFDAARFRKSG